MTGADRRRPEDGRRPAGRGYALYRPRPNWTDHGVADGTVIVHELISLHPEATAALWSHIAMTDLPGTVRAPARPLDDPLQAMVVDGSQVEGRGVAQVLPRARTLGGCTLRADMSKGERRR